MESFVRLCDKLSVACGVASGVLMVFSTLLVLAEIVMRGVFSKTLYITEEYSGYLIVEGEYVDLDVEVDQYEEEEE